VGAIVQDLESRIVDGRMKVGDRLPTERELAADWGVSRTTVREALYELELKSLVRRTRRRGTTVADLSARTVTSEALLSGLSPHARQLAEVLDFRAAIEPAMSARAALYATSSEIAEMESLLEAMEQSDSAERDIELDDRFHRLIAQATHNPLFVQLISDMSTWLRDVRQTQLGISPERRARVISGHALFVEAIRERDPAAAASVAAEHLEQVRRELWPILQADLEPAKQ
jgi:GntR family transcriptional repressor for pyruvate dehydrogenase complex